MTVVSDLEDKFRELASLRTMCPDVMKNVRRASTNIQAKRRFTHIRTEIEEAIGIDEFNRRFEPYLRKIESDESRRDIMVKKAYEETHPLWFSKVPYAVIRQNPVGHGGFHSGTLGVERQRLHWVYDCGSWRKQNSLIECVKEISERITSTGRLDLLFVSHFDDDQFSGLRHLLGTVPRPVDTVVVPYLGSDDMFVVLAGALALNQCPEDLVDQVLDPVRWFRRLGVRRVIRLKPPSMPDESDDGRLPADPRGGTDGPSLPTDIQVSGKEYFGPLFIQPDGKRLSDGKSVVASSGTFAGIWTDQGWADWIFLPFVHPVSVGTRRRLRRLAKSAVGGRRILGRAFKDRLLALLQDQSGRRKLKRIYIDEELGDANAISLSLYVGPDPNASQKRRSYWSDQNTEVIPAGWLLTGDAKLQNYERRLKWLQFFRPMRSSVGTLMLPHHGSAHNFHPGILSVAGSHARLFITADEEDTTRPHQEVREGVNHPILRVSESQNLVSVSGPSKYSGTDIPDLSGW